jgi:hypothetical protein
MSVLADLDKLLHLTIEERRECELAAVKAGEKESEWIRAYFIQTYLISTGKRLDEDARRSG